MALELGGAGIRVNAIARGAVDGDRLHHVLQGRLTAADAVDDVTADALSIQAIKRFVNLNDIAALALFLASDHARSISRQTIPIGDDSSAAA